MCAAQLKRLIGIKRGMNSPEHNPGATQTGRAAYLVSPQGVTGVNTNAHNIAWMNPLQIKVLQSFIADLRITELSICCSR
jgi:hypothetical protein